MHNDMGNTLNTVRWCANIVLGLGCWLIVNEGESLVPNLVGLACAALLIVINRDNDAR